MSSSLSPANRELNTPPWVLVSGGFHDAGGMDKANLALAQYLLQQGVEVHIVSHSVDQEISKHPLAKVHLARLPGGMFSVGEPLLDWKGRKVARSVRNRWPNAPVVVNGGNCIWPGINWVHYVHHAWRTEVAQAPLLYRMKSAAFNSRDRKRERAALQRARLVITNSRRTSQDVVEHLEVDERKVHTIYLGSDPKWGLVTPEERNAARLELQIPESRPLVVFVGALALDHRKGFDVLLQAWQKLCSASDWDADLLVAGAGNALGMWKASVSRAGLVERIRFLGFSNQIKSVLAAADLLVSPVRYEAYGLNVQEAICRGVPCVVSACAGVAEQYPAGLYPMLLPDPNDVSDLVARLLNWRAEIEHWKDRFRPVGEELRQNTWPKMAERIVALVQERWTQGHERKEVGSLG